MSLKIFPPLMTNQSNPANVRCNTMEVEKILDTTLSKDNCRFYKVKWVRTSWESENDLTYFTGAINEFWSRYETPETVLVDSKKDSLHREGRLEVNRKRPFEEVAATVFRSLSTSSKMSQSELNLQQQPTIACGKMQHVVTTCKDTLKATSFKDILDNVFDINHTKSAEGIKIGNSAHVRISTDMLKQDNKSKQISTSDAINNVIPVTKKIFTTLASTKLNTVDKPTKLNMVDKPLNKIPVDKPLNIIPFDKPLNMIPKKLKTDYRPTIVTMVNKPLNVLPGDRPTKVNTDYKPNKVTMADKPKIVIMGDKPVVKKFQHHCNRCGKNLTTDMSYKKHCEAHKTSDALKVCPVCKKQFSRIAHLKVHKLIHINDRRFICQQCNKGFNDKSTLRKHAETHSAVKNFVCEKCQKRFRRKQHLTRHNDSVHKKIRRYDCKLCDKLFYEKAVLTSHMNTHLGIKPFKCSECSKDFADRSSLSKHRSCHLKKKSFDCNICDKTFAGAALLADHQQKHINIVK